jgi:hypothetical protein
VTDPVRQLTESIVAGRRTPYAKVAAIQAFFTDPRNRFQYSTSSLVPGIDSPSALEDFLRGRRGFCEQYASAMAAMIRIAGLPARVAVGFTPGVAQTDGSYRVTTSDAHAWPEAWFAGAGWVRFEPTPRGDGQTTVPAYAAPAGPTVVGQDDPLGPNPSPTLAPGDGGEGTDNAKLNQLDRIDTQAVGDPGAAGPRTARASHRRVLLLAPVAALAVLLLLPRVLYLLRRRRRWHRGGALAGWAQVCEDAADLGHLRRPSDSPRAAAAALAQRYALDATARDALTRLATVAERARYARDGAGAVDGLAHDAALVRSALRAAVPALTRWRAWVLPLSTLQWATSGLGTLVADALDRIDAVWAAVRRVRPA